MKQTVNLHQFREAFRLHERENFSYEALGYLFDWLEQYEADTGEEMELDVIGLCCDFSESSIDNIIENYSLDVAGLNEEERHAYVSDYLHEETVVIAETGGNNYLYQQF
jgi:hypothetical protein